MGSFSNITCMGIVQEFQEGDRMTVQEMRQRKKELGLSNKAVAKLSGVSLGTVQKVFSGETEVPRYETLKKLEKAFADDSPQVDYRKITERNSDRRFVAEQAAYGYSVTAGAPGLPEIHVNLQKGIGPYRLKDYLNLPEDIRVELIDGHFYDMSSPSALHQQWALATGAQLRNYIMKNKGMCVPFIAPMDVQLDSDEKTVLEPDVFVVCDRDKIKKNGIVGAPDLVIEVLSFSSWQRDLNLKLRKYREAGIREYWVILPEQKYVNVYVFAQGPDPSIYTFDEKVPVSIWEGKCKVDMKQIYDSISFLYE